MPLRRPSWTAPPRQPTHLVFPWGNLQPEVRLPARRKPLPANGAGERIPAQACTSERLRAYASRPLVLPDRLVLDQSTSGRLCCVASVRW